MPSINDRIGSQNVIRVLSNASAPPSRLLNLTDVDSTSQTDGNLLIWDATDNKFFMSRTLDSTEGYEFSGGTKGQYHDMLDAHSHMEWTNKKLLEHYMKCTGKKEPYIRKHLLAPKTDHWLTPEEAIKHGIADKLVETY